MKQFSAFLKKEFTEHIRSGRMMIMGIIFVIIGVMNPAVAKLTPWLMDMFAESLAESGMIMTEVTVTAMDSWMQFFKNLPIAIIAFLLLESGVFTREYQSGTLILALTKGLDRYKVVISKSLVMLIMWTVFFWLTFGITYGYNAYYWDNSIASDIFGAMVCSWLFGVFLVAAVTLFSTVLEFNTGALVGAGGVVLLSYIVGFIPAVSKYVPTHLLDGYSILTSKAELSSYAWSCAITSVLSISAFVGSIFAFNKKQL